MLVSPGFRARFAALVGAVLLASCGGDGPAAPDVRHHTPLEVLGLGVDTARYTAEIAVHDNTAYTTTWGYRSAAGNAIRIWDVSGDTPTLVDSVIVANTTTIGDVAVSDDGSLLVIATERVGGAMVVYDLANPRKPVQLARFSNSDTYPGVHTAEIGRVNGRLYAFLSIDPLNTTPARLVIVDLSAPSAPIEIFTKVVGTPYVHDSFVRDGLLFVGLWDDGIEIWDVGGGGAGGTPARPQVLGGVKTLGGEAHNIWWYHDPSGGKRYAFVGQEGAGTFGSSSSGDIHVVDVSDFSAPKEVAFYHVPGAGTHNFSVDEVHGVLYAAYYNAGVRAIDIRGDLGTCSDAQRDVNVPAHLSRCNLALMGRELGAGLVELDRPTYVWGVEYLNGVVYASDMLNGIWKLNAAK
jgi:hypothetical protein